MRKILLCLFCSVLIGGCKRSTDTEKYQTERKNIVNVHDQVKEISTGDVLLGSSSHSCILENYLVMGDPMPMEYCLHIFDKNTFAWVLSTTRIGQGPDEMTNMGYIACDESHNAFYVSDHGKQKIFCYEMDSLLHNPNYKRKVKVEMNESQFPSTYQYINDTLSLALLIKPTSASTFEQEVAKWNMKTGKFHLMPYRHPEIERKRIAFAASAKDSLYVECYSYHDLMSICRFDGSLVCNVYGPVWDSFETNRVKHYGRVTIAGNKIIASYSGKEKFAQNKFIVFDLKGNYLKTLDVGYQMLDFCYDADNNRLIMNFDDVIQSGYLDLDGII